MQVWVRRLYLHRYYSHGLHQHCCFPCRRYRTFAHCKSAHNSGSYCTNEAYSGVSRDHNAYSDIYEGGNHRQAHSSDEAPNSRASTDSQTHNNIHNDYDDRFYNHDNNIHHDYDDRFYNYYSYDNHDNYNY